MAIAIPMERLQGILSEEIGSALAHSSLSSHLAEKLRRYRTGDDLLRLREELRTEMFQSLYGILGAKMTVTLPSGENHRIRMDALPRLADNLLATLFEALGTSGMPKDTLMRFAMTSGSLCAMRTLLAAYPVTDREKALLERILRESDG